MTEKKRFQIPRAYKTLLALAVVIGPITWLTFTEDGQRRTDLMLLGFMDEPFVEMRLDTLASAATEDQVREFLPKVQWQCRNARSAFGERSCTAAIGAFNDVPARYLVLYYDANALQAMKVVYREGYHRFLLTQLNEMLGKGENGAGGVTQWKTERGLVLMPREAGESEGELSLMWLSAERALRLGESGRS